jgi:hypothetical protein
MTPVRGRALGWGFFVGFMRSRQSATNKSQTYFALIESFGKRGCPVCRLMEEYSLHYLDVLFYEQVNDVGIRRKLREARGFCNWHAWRVRKIANSALGVAIIAKDLITEEVMRLDDLLRRSLVTRLHDAIGHSISRTSLRAFLQAWRQKRICPACEMILDHERHALETLLNFLHEAEFARRFESSTALCVIHTRRAAEANGAHPHLRTLLDIQRRKYMSLVRELEAFCRKHDYRFSHESWGSESDAWLRAIELLAGKPDVFGNEIQRKRPADGGVGWWVRLIDRFQRWVLVGASSVRARDGEAKQDEFYRG